MSNAGFRTDLSPIDDSCGRCTCTHCTRAHRHHLFRAKERLSATPTSIHNERFVVRLLDGAREAFSEDTCFQYRHDVLGRYYGG